MWDWTCALRTSWRECCCPAHQTAARSTQHDNWSTGIPKVPRTSVRRTNHFVRNCTYTCNDFVKIPKRSFSESSVCFILCVRTYQFVAACSWCKTEQDTFVYRINGRVSLCKSACQHSTRGGANHIFYTSKYVPLPVHLSGECGDGRRVSGFWRFCVLAREARFNGRCFWYCHFRELVAALHPPASLTSVPQTHH